MANPALSHLSVFKRNWEPIYYCSKPHELYIKVVAVFVHLKIQVPVYRGCENSLIGIDLKASHVHGSDGMGDMKDPPTVNMADLQKEHAVSAIIRLANQHPGK